MRVRLTPDRVCEDLSERQHGVISRRQALAVGMPGHAIQRRLRRGDWLRAQPGVYRLRGASASWRSRLAAACLWAGPRSFVSHRAAGHLYGLLSEEEATIELAVWSGEARPGVIAHRLQSTDRPPLREVAGFQVASPERTLLDLAATLVPSRAGRALDEALRRGLTTLAKLRAYLREHGRRGRDGTAALRMLLAVRDELDARAESELESRLLALMRRAGLPPPALQHEIRTRRGPPIRLDFAYPDLRLGLEAHGYRWHGGQQRWQRDIRRENHLKRMGWTVLVYTWDDVVGDPARVSAEVRDVLVARAAA